MKIIDDDIVAIGGSLDPGRLMQAYGNGIFPWPIEGMPLPWFCPMQRAIVDFNELHVPRSLSRIRRKEPFFLTIDKAFDQVIEWCATVPRAGEQGTWITDEMLAAYKELRSQGHAHSVEAWSGDELVGGVYGIDGGGYFSAESMFHLKPYASKLALLHLIDYLRGRGLQWLDIQVLTPHMEALGAKLVSRDVFLRLMADAQKRHRQKLFD